MIREVLDEVRSSACVHTTDVFVAEIERARTFVLGEVVLVVTYSFKNAEKINADKDIKTIGDETTTIVSCHCMYYTLSVHTEVVGRLVRSLQS